MLCVIYLGSLLLDCRWFIVTRAACYNYIVNGALKKSCYLVASVRKLIKKLLSKLCCPKTHEQWLYKYCTAHAFWDIFPRVTDFFLGTGLSNRVFFFFAKDQAGSYRSIIHWVKVGGEWGYIWRLKGSPVFCPWNCFFSWCTYHKLAVQVYSW